MNEVNVELGNIFIRIDGKNLTPNIISEIQGKMSYVIPDYKFLSVYKKNPNWDGAKTVVRRVAGGILQAPSGLCSYLKEIFNENSIIYLVVDKRLSCFHSLGAYDYKNSIIETILVFHERMKYFLEHDQLVQASEINQKIENTIQGFMIENSSETRCYIENGKTTEALKSVEKMILNVIQMSKNRRNEDERFAVCN